jgi:hypothetical protein
MFVFYFVHLLEQELKTAGKEATIFISLDCMRLSRASLSVSENGTIIALHTGSDDLFAYFQKDFLLDSLFCGNVVKSELFSISYFLVKEE